MQTDSGRPLAQIIVIQLLVYFIILIIGFQQNRIFLPRRASLIGCKIKQRLISTMMTVTGLQTVLVQVLMNPTLTSSWNDQSYIIT